MSREDHGSFTAETAVALPGLVFVLAAALWAVQAIGTKVTCIDAARSAARAAARGEPLPAVRTAASQVAPRNARISLERKSNQVVVDVVARVSFGSDHLPTLKTHGRSVADVEWPR